MNSMAKDGSTRIPRAWMPFLRLQTERKTQPHAKKHCRREEYCAHSIVIFSPKAIPNASNERASVHKKTKIEH